MAAKRTRKASSKTVEPAAGPEVDLAAEPAVPGPSPDPVTNLVMADILIRAGGYIVRRAVEKNLLKGRYGKDTAKEILANRKPGQTFAAFAAARLATRSVPGAAVVGTGIGLKMLLDLSNKRRARLKGERKLARQAKGED
ncbi:hypothetical protein LY632_05035 [Erythrobacter sp. SDW2]|uniref:hypothetical protein n=1 Tax=Erythrobacter sp. SDW2 TaxID=2907154 RepID=UPI001F367987|nr:hypothetical protein [Erythrobacter sp. SDW2]UIP07766.1 hypothetical protein LY632_05035 [Erythrobacter sp. SDW2]